MASASELAAEWSSTAAAVGIGSDYDSSVGERRIFGISCFLSKSLTALLSWSIRMKAENMSDLCVYAKFAYLFHKYLPHVMRVLLEATSGAQVLLQMVPWYPS